MHVLTYLLFATMQIPNKFVNLPPVSPRVTTVPLSTEDLLRTNRTEIKYKIICLITLYYSSITSSSVAGLSTANESSSERAHASYRLPASTPPGEQEQWEREEKGHFSR